MSSSVKLPINHDERVRVIAKERARVRKLVKEFCASTKPLEQRATETVELFLLESLHTNGEANDVKRRKTGAKILDAPNDTRCAILLAAVEALSKAPWEASTWEVNVICDARFVHDYRWGLLIKAILQRRPKVTEDFVEAILEGLAQLADRFNSNYPCNNYEFPFDQLIRFVDKQIPACSLERLMPAIRELLASIQTAVANDLVSLKGYSKAKSKSLSQDPGKWFKKSDRTAIALIEGWLQ